VQVVWYILAQHSIVFHFKQILTKLEYCTQQHPNNVNNWDPNRTPKKPEKDLFWY